MKRLLKPLALAVVIAACLSAASCGRYLGYGVVLWTDDATKLPSGSVVPVYIRSSIEKNYVVGIPGSSDKVELALWQLEFFDWEGKAQDYAAGLGELASVYAKATKDSLPMREEAQNAAKRVFRLREGQSVKLLRKVQGEAVFTGGKALPGDWYLAMADDGTRGYVFSYSLRIYDEKDEVGAATTGAGDRNSLEAKLGSLFKKPWRPEYFQTMADKGIIDLERFAPRFGLFTDPITMQIRIELPGSSAFFNYSGASLQGDKLAFSGTGLLIGFEGGKAVACYAGKDGKARTEAFIQFDGDVMEIIRAEESRRQRLLEAFVEAAGSLTDERGGTLSVGKSRLFTWTGRSDLENALGAYFFPEGSRDTGSVKMNLVLGPVLAGQYEGVIGFVFDGVGEGSRVDFAYKREGQGVVFDLVRPENVVEGAVESMPAEPLRFQLAAKAP